VLGRGKEKERMRMMVEFRLPTTEEVNAKIRDGQHVSQ
jgi:hypothetical protein